MCELDRDHQGDFFGNFHLEMVDMNKYRSSLKDLLIIAQRVTLNMLSATYQNYCVTFRNEQTAVVLRFIWLHLVTFNQICQYLGQHTV